FGKGSIHDRLVQVGGKVCTIGVGLRNITLLDHIEEIGDIPLRYKKLYTGFIREASVPAKLGWICSVPLVALQEKPYAEKLDAVAKTSGKCVSARMGSGEIMCVAAADVVDLLATALAAEPPFRAHEPSRSPVERERTIVPNPDFQVALCPNASMSEMIQALWRLPRDIVSDGYDAALQCLAAQVPMTIHEYPSGTECWSWIIPEKWKCNEAYLATLGGRRLFSYA